MKTGVVDVGGGLRGIYAAGVLDFCMDHDIRFDVCIGVSAGSANMASYVSGQRGRNYVFYTEYTFRKEYMSLKNFLTKRSYIDMDYIYGTLSNTGGENPFDYDAFVRSPQQFIAVAADAETGQAHYFTKEDMPRDHYDVLKASCAIPFVCHPYTAAGRPCFDGALADPVPVQKAFDLGCDKVVLILTKPRDFVRTAGKDRRLAAGIRKKYPVAAEQLCLRADRYNQGVRLAERYEKAGKLLFVAPDDTCGMDTLKKDAGAMKEFYRKGLKDAESIGAFLKGPSPV